MAKGLRSKVKRRYRTVKRVHVNEVIEKPNLKKLNEKIKLMLHNRNIFENIIKPPNKFLYPDDEKAIIPQHKIKKKIDFRSEALPLSGLATVGNRRKYSLNEKIELKSELGGNPNFHDNINVNKIIDDMHKRSKEVMKNINKKEGRNKK